MNMFKLTLHDTGRHNSSSSVVSVRILESWGMSDVLSPSDIVGTGDCYRAALEDFIDQFEKYIESLQRFKEEVLDTKRAYEDVVSVDFAGNPV